MHPARLLTNFLCLPDLLICLSRIDLAERFAWFAWAGPVRLERGAWFSWAGLIRLGMGAWLAWAGLIRLKRLPDLHDQDFWSCSENQAIRQGASLFAGLLQVRLYKIRKKLKSGSGLIGQAATWSKSGRGLIGQGAAWSNQAAPDQLGRCPIKISQAAAWSIRTPVREKSTLHHFVQKRKEKK